MLTEFVFTIEVVGWALSTGFATIASILIGLSTIWLTAMLKERDRIFRAQAGQIASGIFLLGFALTTYLTFLQAKFAQKPADAWLVVLNPSGEPNLLGLVYLIALFLLVFASVIVHPPIVTGRLQLILPQPVTSGRVKHIHFKIFATYALRSVALNAAFVGLFLLSADIATLSADEIQQGYWGRIVRADFTDNTRLIQVAFVVAVIGVLFLSYALRKSMQLSAGVPKSHSATVLLRCCDNHRQAGR